MKTAIDAALVRLVFVDSAIDDSDALVTGVTPNTEVVLLNPAEDGIAQITAALRQYTHVATIHIVSHGSSGSLRLGNSCLNLTTLPQYRSQLQQWRSALSANAEILLYGCQVASGRSGAAFIKQLHSILGYIDRCFFDANGQCKVRGKLGFRWGDRAHY